MMCHIFSIGDRCELQAGQSGTHTSTKSHCCSMFRMRPATVLLNCDCDCIKWHQFSNSPRSIFLINCYSRTVSCIATCGLEGHALSRFRPDFLLSDLLKQISCFHDRLLSQLLPLFSPLSWLPLVSCTCSLLPTLFNPCCAFSQPQLITCCCGAFQPSETYTCWICLMLDCFWPLTLSSAWPFGFVSLSLLFWIWLWTMYYFIPVKIFIIWVLIRQLLI